MATRALLALCLLVVLSVTAQAREWIDRAPGTYWKDSERGWHWYEDPPKEQPPAKALKAPPPGASEVAAFEALQKRLETLQRIAYIRPTEQNVRNYLELQAAVVEKSSYFADVWQRVVWATPDLDYTVTGRPVNAKALEVFNSESQRTRTSTIAALGKNHVLLFFFRSDCPYCHQFAPYLREFEAKFGIKVEAVSLDRGALPDFPHPRIDNGISRTLDVKHVPALYLAEPAAGKITPIGFGLLSEGELLERIQVVTRPGADRMVPGVAKRAILQ